MSALTVINGIHKEELQKQAESYAFRAGMHTRSLECFLRENGRAGNEPAAASGETQNDEKQI